jgi:hypothetical protein
MKTKTTKKNNTIDLAAVYPKWQKADTRAAADVMHAAQAALLDARAAWEAAGKPNTEEHRLNSERLQADLDKASRAFSLLSRRDLSQAFA